MTEDLNVFPNARSKLFGVVENIIESDSHSTYEQMVLPA